MSSDVVTVAPETPFTEVVDVLVSHGFSGVPVVDGQGTLVGIVTEADLISKEAFGGKRRRPLQVLSELIMGGETTWVHKAHGQEAEGVMTRQLKTVTETDDVRAAARLMIEADIKRLPVVDNEGRLVGIVSRTDLMRAMHRSDADVLAEVKAMLNGPRYVPEGHDVTVSVDNGVVTFEGTTEFPMDLPLLEAVAWRVPAVVAVDNRATGRLPDPDLR